MTIATHTNPDPDESDQLTDQIIGMVEDRIKCDRVGPVLDKDSLRIDIARLFRDEFHELWEYVAIEGELERTKEERDELLKACEVLVGIEGMTDGEDCMYCQMKPCATSCPVGLARKAIAKARGANQ